MTKYVIIHGQLYEVSDDELMHWMYLKRERVNGKWRYYYKTYGIDNRQQAVNNRTSEVAKNSNASDNSQNVNQSKTTMSATERLMRGIETARTWLDSRLDRTVVDTIKGTAPKPLTWEQAKEAVSKKKMRTIRVNGKTQYYFN